MDLNSHLNPCLKGSVELGLSLGSEGVVRIDQSVLDYMAFG